MAKGTPWMLTAPESVISDRTLPPDPRAEYQAQLAQVSILLNQRLKQLAEQQLGQAARRPPAPPGMNLEADNPTNPMTEQVVAALNAKSGPIARFMEAEVHFRWGQFRDGLTTTTNGWKELLEYYRSNRNVSPADAQVHFESLDRLAADNPLQALVILNHLDPLYRTMIQVDQFFGAKIADTWVKLAGDLPLNVPMLTKAAFWAEHASRMGKQQEGKYTSALAEIKRKLEEASEQEEGAEEGHEGKGEKHEAGNKTGNKPAARDKEQAETREQRTVGGRALPIPKKVDSTRGGS
jgi:hypothetical protein